MSFANASLKQLLYDGIIRMVFFLNLQFQCTSTKKNVKHVLDFKKNVCNALVA